MAKSNNEIDEELVCIDSLRHVLECKLGLPVGVPMRVDPGKDPPDFWLQIADTNTPVEVTSIIQRAAFIHQARQMAKTLKNLALESQILHGTYVLIFRGFPPIPHPRRKREWQIFDTAMDYISGTANSDVGDELDLFDELSDHIALRKLSVNGANVTEMLAHAEWGAESQEKIRDLIDMAAQTKVSKLAKNGHSSLDAILVLYDAYAFVEFDSVVECVADLASLKSFAAVYWASAFAERENFTYPYQPGRDGGFIASRLATWQGANSMPTTPEQ